MCLKSKLILERYAQKADRTLHPVPDQFKVEGVTKREGKEKEDKRWREREERRSVFISMI